MLKQDEVRENGARIMRAQLRLQGVIRTRSELVPHLQNALAQPVAFFVAAVLEKSRGMNASFCSNYVGVEVFGGESKRYEDTDVGRV